MFIIVFRTFISSQKVVITAQLHLQNAFAFPKYAMLKVCLVEKPDGVACQIAENISNCYKI